MQRKRTDIDLMAPVGSYESLMAAIQAGSNSIYFGIEQLNMRARSSNNFTFDDLRNIVSICEEHNVKTYLTVNTIIYDEEMEKMHKVVDAAAENHVTAIIASDIAVMQYARSKGVEVHASTQLNISNIEAVTFFAQFCDVMVTARELSLDQVKYITDQIRQRDMLRDPSQRILIEPNDVILVEYTTFELWFVRLNNVDSTISGPPIHHHILNICVCLMQYGVHRSCYCFCTIPCDCNYRYFHKDRAKVQLF